MHKTDSMPGLWGEGAEVYLHKPPTRQNDKVSFPESIPSLLPDLDLAVTAQQTARHAPQKTWNTQGLFQEKEREITFYYLQLESLY